jgi:hypothetical protein
VVFERVDNGCGHGFWREVETLHESRGLADCLLRGLCRDDGGG